MTIEDYIKAEKLTQQGFATLLGVSQGLVSQWISGDVQITAERAKSIEEATGGAIHRHDLRPDIFDAPRKGRAA